MTVQQINALSQHQQYRSLLLHGACIADRVEEDYTILLFQVHKQYVEVYLTLEENKVLHSRRFDDIEELRPYL